MQKTVFVTGNPKKAEYFSKLIGIEFDQHAMELDEIQSLGLKKISEHKARQAYQVLERPVVVEDIGLKFTALGDLPGPFIKFFVEAESGLEKLCRMLDGFDDRTATATVEYCYFDGNVCTFFSGEQRGSITMNPVGEGGYGFDPIWCVDGYGGRTRAQLTEAEDHETYLEIRPLDQLRAFFEEKHGKV